MITLKNKIRKKLLDKNKTITWLVKEMGVSRMMFYRKIKKNDIDFISKINEILKNCEEDR